LDDSGNPINLEPEVVTQKPEETKEPVKDDNKQETVDTTPTPTAS
jgi:hypothetical protein